MTNKNCINDNLDNICPCTTRPPNLEEKTFTKLFQNDIHKLNLFILSSIDVIAIYCSLLQLTCM